MKKFTASHPWRLAGLITILMVFSIVLAACNFPGSEPTEERVPPSTPPETAPTEALPEAPVETEPPVDYSGDPIVGPVWYWLTTRFNNDTTTNVSDPANYNITFNADGTFNGKADCNSFSGSYILDGSNIMIDPMIATTMAMCPEGSLDTEFLQQIGQAVIYFIQDGYLYFDMPADTGTMQFGNTPEALVPVKDYSAAPFVDKVWQWLRFDSSDGSSTIVPQPEIYNIYFNPDGLFTGQADCNSFSGDYTTTEGSALQITVGPMTLVACAPESLSDAYLAYLGQVATYVIEQGVLYLNLAVDSGNMVFGEQPVAVLPPAEDGQPGLTATSNVNVRNGPGTNYVVYGVMPAGRSAQVIGKSTDGAWWVVSLPLAPLGQGWVSGDYSTAVNAENVPVIQAPPVPATVEFSPPGPTDPQVKALDAVYVRSGPGEAFPAYGVAQKDQLGLVIGRSQDGLWWTVRLNPAVVSTGFGWVSTYYAQPSNIPDDVPVIEAPPLPPPAAIPAPPTGAASGVTMTALNVRSGPGTNYTILAVAPAGTVGEITGKSADNAWWQVRVPTNLSPDGFAWVSAGFVYATNTQNVPVVGAPPPPAQATATPGANPTKPPAPLYTVTPTKPPTVSTDICSVVSSKPNGLELKINQSDADMRAELKNVSKEIWDQNKFDIKFISAVNGVEIHQGEDIYDLPQSVNAGDTFSLAVDLKAPGTPGNYGETWGLFKGSTLACSWSISIVVK